SPYVGANREEVLGKAKAADLADALARLDGCGADAELIALAKRCLAAEPEGRPRDAGEVAEAVAAYQAGGQERARQAGLERAEGRGQGTGSGGQGDGRGGAAGRTGGPGQGQGGAAGAAAGGGAGGGGAGGAGRRGLVRLAGAGAAGGPAAGGSRGGRLARGGG